VIVTTNLKTSKTAPGVLLSSDWTLGYDQFIDYYRLRFQLEIFQSHYDSSRPLSLTTA
jgi:hypothetical protein